MLLSPGPLSDVRALVSSAPPPACMAPSLPCPFFLQPEVCPLSPWDLCLTCVACVTRQVSGRAHPAPPDLGALCSAQCPAAPHSVSPLALAGPVLGSPQHTSESVGPLAALERPLAVRSDACPSPLSPQDGSYLAEFLLEKGYEVSDAGTCAAGTAGPRGLPLPVLPSSCACFPPRR